MSGPFWTFTLVGMKYCGSSAREALEIGQIALFPDKNNAVDENAIQVWGLAGDTMRRLGHVSISTQPADNALLLYGEDGTVYDVVTTDTNPNETAVFFRVDLSTVNECTVKI